MPYDELPTLRNTSMYGVMGSTIYDTFSNATLLTWASTNLTTAVCMTTFKTDCEVAPVHDFSHDEAAQQWTATFEDGWTARVDYATAIFQADNTQSMLRIVPVPVSCPPMFLLLRDT
jgi:hypothetical protein